MTQTNDHNVSKISLNQNTSLVDSALDVNQTGPDCQDSYPNTRSAALLFENQRPVPDPQQETDGYVIKLSQL